MSSFEKEQEYKELLAMKRLKEKEVKEWAAKVNSKKKTLGSGWMDEQNALTKAEDELTAIEGQLRRLEKERGYP
jgi:hypothetical protein